jgi:hypothetical protein
MSFEAEAMFMATDGSTGPAPVPPWPVASLAGKRGREDFPMRESVDLELPTQENVQTDIRSIFQGAIRVALEVILEEVIREMVGASRWERLGQRLDRRNGTYLRQVMTSMGTVELAVRLDEELHVASGPVKRVIAQERLAVGSERLAERLAGGFERGSDVGGDRLAEAERAPDADYPLLVES